MLSATMYESVGMNWSEPLVNSIITSKVWTLTETCENEYSTCICVYVRFFWLSVYLCVFDRWLFWICKCLRMSVSYEGWRMLCRKLKRIWTTRTLGMSRSRLNLSHCRSASFSGKAEVLSEVMRSIRVLRKLCFPGFLRNLYPYNMLPNYPLEIPNL